MIRDECNKSNNMRLLPRAFVLSMLVLQDALLIAFGFVAAYWLRFSDFFRTYVPAPKGIPPLQMHFGVIVLYVMVWLISLHAVGLYRRYRERSAVDEFYSVLVAGFFAGVIVATVALLLRYQWLSRLVFVMSAVLSVFTVGIGRALHRAVENWLWRHGIGLLRVAIIGHSNEVQQFVRQLQSAQAGCRVVGTIAMDKQCEVTARSSAQWENCVA
ncbi:MAG TPA: hypothetical protein EYP10_04100, partial [Armatimonadetes bacterium]|nr:hypothetical protein [Armatimonadota bacterium]